MVKHTYTFTCGLVILELNLSNSLSTFVIHTFPMQLNTSMGHEAYSTVRACKQQKDMMGINDMSDVIL